MHAFEAFTQLVRTLTGKSTISTITDVQNAEQLAFLRSLKQQQSRNKEALLTPLDQLELVVFDMETTGFRPQKGDEIISIGAVKMNGLQVVEETFYTLVKPTQRIPQNIIELTGIDQEMTAKAPTLREALLAFLVFAKGCTLVAHHANHERNFMKHYSQQLLQTPFNQRIVDTAFLIQICEYNHTLVTLDDVCLHQQIPIIGRHHALSDAKMTAQVWLKYVQQAMNLGCDNLQDVYERFARL